MIVEHIIRLNEENIKTILSKYFKTSSDNIALVYETIETGDERCPLQETVVYAEYTTKKEEVEI